MLGSHARALILFLSAILFVIALACGDDDAEGQSDFAQGKGGTLGLSKEEGEGSGIGVNVTAAKLTVVDGVKQWDGPPKGLTGGLLIVYKDEFTVTVEMETVGGQPANGKKIVLGLWHSDNPTFKIGDITFTVNNFVFLAREGFYDGLPFHRVVPGSIVQTGDPPGPLDGAGYVFDNEVTNGLRHDRPGIVSMANKGVVDGQGTNSSQWFITLEPLPHLNYYDEDLRKRDCTQQGTSCHTPFGWVIEGMDVVESIVEGDVIKTVTVEKVEQGTIKVPS
ncbi:MAG: peptidylprolyl isomerase [Chloroflexi bacterium]|nr:peptidylprolyl isomerase [Chloroflexota bacterium]